MERVSNEWLDEAIPKYSIIDSKSKGANVYLALCELRERRQIDSLVKFFVDGHTDNSANEKDGAEAAQEKAVLPIPCTKGFEGWTVKDYFQQVNEELDELKETVLTRISGMNMNMCDTMDEMYEAGAEIIAEEATDTITAITSMLEAMGIDEQARQAAQRRVNERNRERERL